IVCGPQIDPAFAPVVTQFARKWNLPLLADPLSQIRHGEHGKDCVIDGYDALLRTKEIRAHLAPDFIIRFGAMPVSKPYLFYVQEHTDIPQIVVENSEGYREPANHLTQFIYADQAQVATHLTSIANDNVPEDELLKQMQQLNTIIKKHLCIENEETVSEGSVVRFIHQMIPEQSTFFIGNSMAIRDVDTFFTTTKKEVDFLANRGANGIDGVISSAMGAATTGERVTLLIGDLSFYHDMNGLLASRLYALNMTIVLVNNNGGGIFSFLPQAKDPTYFETLFGTPSHLNFAHAVNMYNGVYECPASNKDFQEALQNSYARKGLTVIEVQTERRENATWHRKIWQNIEEEMQGVLP